MVMMMMGDGIDHSTNQSIMVNESINQLIDLTMGDGVDSMAGEGND